LMLKACFIPFSCMRDRPYGVLVKKYSFIYANRRWCSISSRNTIDVPTCPPILTPPSTNHSVTPTLPPNHINNQGPDSISDNGLTIINASPITPINDQVPTSIGDTGLSIVNGYHDFISYKLMNTDGVGFLTSAQFALEGLHLWTGLPWWGTIVLGAALLRVILSPFHWFQIRTTHKLQINTTLLKECNEKMMELNATGAPDEELHRNYTKRKVIDQNGLILFGKFMFSLLAQFPFFICVFFALRNMCREPIWAQELLNGGAYWFTDLTVTDPLYVFPIVGASLVSATMFVAIFSQGATTKNVTVSKILLPTIWIMTFFFIMFFPTAVNIWVLSNGVYGLLITVLIQFNSVRNILRLGPLPKPPS